MRVYPYITEGGPRWSGSKLADIMAVMSGCADAAAFGPAGGQLSHNREVGVSATLATMGATAGNRPPFRGGVREVAASRAGRRRTGCGMTKICSGCPTVKHSEVKGGRTEIPIWQGIAAICIAMFHEKRRPFWPGAFRQRVFCLPAVTHHARLPVCIDQNAIRISRYVMDGRVPGFGVRRHRPALCQQDGNGFTRSRAPAGEAGVGQSGRGGRMRPRLAQARKPHP
jgi:hypothetical protein